MDFERTNNSPSLVISLDTLVNFEVREIARNTVNTGKFTKYSILIQSEQITTQNVYYRLLYLVDFLLFCGNGAALIFKGGLSGVWYQTPKTLSDRELRNVTKFTSVRPKYLSNRGKIHSFSNSSPRLSCEFF